MFIKTRTKYASKGGIELAVFKAFREVLIEVLSFGFGVAELILVHSLLIGELSLIHTVIYDVYKQTHNSEKEIKVLSLSSNQKHCLAHGQNYVRNGVVKFQVDRRLFGA